MVKANKYMDNMRVFFDTQKTCKKSRVLMQKINESIMYQEFIPEGKILSDNGAKKKDKNMQVLVSSKRTLEAAKGYTGKQVCILNFANAETPGGGVSFGATTQEEGLCRCSTLYENISIDAMQVQFYKPHKKSSALYNDDIIYTPDVIVFKTDTREPHMMSEDEWYPVNVITCAAPDLGSTRKKVSISTPELSALHYKRAKRILEVAKLKGNQVVILGAFGCGDFRNPPEIVARAFADALKDYKGCFETVEFAVYCSSKDKRNYKVFNSILSV